MLGIMMVKGKGENGDVDENDDGWNYDDDDYITLMMIVSS